LLIIKYSDNTVFAFDLDDTLYKEVDFLRSGFSEIARRVSKANWYSIFLTMMEKYWQGEDVFEHLLANYNSLELKKQDLLSIYRNHIPEIVLDVVTEKFLRKLNVAGVKKALITDGRAVTQRNKLKSLGLENYFDYLVISEEVGSEKPSEYNFKLVEEHFGAGEFIYIGDNYSKDFIAPNRLGWRTIALQGDDRNIHACNQETLPAHFLPQHIPQFHIVA